jgi:hypothetical protein
MPAAAMLEIQVNYHPILMKVGTQTKKNMLSSKVIKAEAYGKKNSKN